MATNKLLAGLTSITAERATVGLSRLPKVPQAQDLPAKPPGPHDSSRLSRSCGSRSRCSMSPS